MYRNSLTAPVFGLRREIDRLFEDTFQNGGERTGWVPPVNVRETAGEFSFEVELAGMKPEEVEVTCDNGVLVVRGERLEARKEGEEGRYHIVERSYGSFSRSFQLPQGVDDERIDARFDNGLLRVRVPKAAIPQPRRINIQGAGASGEAREHVSGTPRGDSNAGRKSAAGEPKQRGEMAANGSR